MPRSKDAESRIPEAERLRALRGVLGLSQRALAEEFKVAHGAVALWESGQRTIPGPVLKLMDLYEAQLGMVDREGRYGLPSLPSGWAARILRGSRTSARLAATMAGVSLLRLVAGQERAAQIKEAAELTIARALFGQLSELKGLAMKLGQMVSYLDLELPEELQRALAPLQHQAAPLAPQVIEGVIEAELGRPPSALFSRFSPRPFASGSIGQVHSATLSDGTRVAVKVQYPGIKSALSADLLAARALDEAGRAVFRHQERGAVLAELSERLLEECDYTLEAARQRTFRALYKDHEDIIIPEVFEELSGPRVLTMELQDGLRFDDFLEAADDRERSRAGALINQLAFDSIFSHHLFNCDPHPGNYLFRDGKVVFLDFGCVKRFTPGFIQTWRAYARAVLEDDRPAHDRLAIQMGFAPSPERFDFDYHRRMMIALYEPWLTDGIFRFNRHFVRATWRMFVIDNPNKFRMNIPKDCTFLNRLQWGLYAVLARLEAASNWRRPILGLLY